MFGYDSPKQKARADWSGTLIGLGLLPLFFFFVYLGRPEMGFTLGLIAGAAIVAIKFQWKHRHHIWFWATIALVLALHVPLLFVVTWPKTNVPTILYSMPFCIVEFLVVTGATKLGEKLFGKDSSEEDRP